MSQNNTFTSPAESRAWAEAISNAWGKPGEGGEPIDWVYLELESGVRLELENGDFLELEGVVVPGNADVFPSNVAGVWSVTSNDSWH